MPASRYIVSDVMTHTAVAVGRGAPYQEIVALMDQWKVSALPVLEGEGRGDRGRVDGRRVATIRGALADRALVPLLLRAVRAVEGIVDVRGDLAPTPRPFHDGQSS